MKRAVLLFLLFLFLLIFCSTNVLGISADSYCVIDADSGKILYEKNAFLPCGMASTTKIMTALVALESGKIHEIATVSDEAARTEGSSLYLKPGEKINVYDLICGLMLNSGNDAAVVIAEHVSGSVEKFVEKMNDKALSIGAQNTHFTNPSGLSDDAHYTTAYDLACIAAYALKNKHFSEIVSTKQMVIETIGEGRKIYLSNHNKLLNAIEGCEGVKTGFTKATGRCLVSAVRQNGFQTICVTLNAPDDWNDHKALYRNVYSEFEKVTLINEGESLGTFPVLDGTEGYVEGVVSKTVEFVTQRATGDMPEVLKEFSSPLIAPVLRGQTIGKIMIKDGENIIAYANVLAKKDVPAVEKITYSGILVKLFSKVFYMLK